MIYNKWLDELFIYYYYYINNETFIFKYSVNFKLKIRYVKSNKFKKRLFSVDQDLIKQKVESLRNTLQISVTNNIPNNSSSQYIYYS